MKKRNVAVLFLFLTILYLPVFSVFWEHWESLYQKCVYVCALLYVFFVFATLITKFLTFCWISEMGVVYKKKERIRWLLCYLMVLLFLFVLYLYTKELLLFSTVILAGGMVFADISSTIIEIDGEKYYYSDKTFEKVKVSGIEEKKGVICLELEGGKKKIVPFSKT